MRRPSLVWALGLAAVAAVVAVIVALQQRGVWRVAYYFDEMWRVDLIHSSNTYQESLLGTAPLPYGWIYGFKILNPFNIGPPGMRAAELILFVGGLVILFLTLIEVTKEGQKRPAIGAVVVALATCATLPLLQIFVHQSRYFNNYLFEVTYSFCLLYACVMLDRSRRAFPALLVLIVLCPLFSLSSLFLLPGVIIRTALWVWSSDERRTRVFALGIALGAAGAVLLGAYLGLYRAVTDANPQLEGFWASEELGAPRGGPLMLARTLSSIRIGVFSAAGIEFDGVGGVLVTSLLIVSAAIGAWTLYRRWPWLMVIIGTGWVTLVMAGVVTSSPVTPIRVTLGYYALVFAVIVFGFFEMVRALAAWVAQRVSMPRLQHVAVAAVGVLTLVALWPELRPPVGQVFARGFGRDLDVVANSPSDDNLVLVYHFMSIFYAHDRLANEVDDPSRFTLIPEFRGDDSMYENPDRYVRRHLPRGGIVWCVVPFALGTEVFYEACQFDRDDLVKVDELHGVNAQITGYRVPAS
jgi:hypothetical protein